MWGRRRDDDYPLGYGDLDEILAHRLFSATSAREADQIAQEDGHQDAEAAIKWLAERSPGGWVG